MRYLLAAALVVMLALPVAAQDFDKGMEAYKRDDYATALKELRPLAEQGDPKAQRYLGWLYQYGKGVEKDPRKAVKWYRAAARQGDAQAQNEMGQAYIWGEERGVRWDPAQAEEWFLKAAKQGNQQAQASLGKIYSGGGFDLWLSAKGPIKYGNVSAERRDHEDRVCRRRDPASERSGVRISRHRRRIECRRQIH